MCCASRCAPNRTTLIPFYCNPFFRRCNQNFQKIENFYQRSQEKPKNPPNHLPKSPPNGAQSSTGQCQPLDHTPKQPGGIADPQVTPANLKAQNDPAPQGPQRKGHVCKKGMSGTKGTEKIIQHAEAVSQQKGPQKTVGSILRCGHCIRRRSQLPFRRDSS